MPDSFFCIYSGKEWPESERSKEHIVPDAIGGPSEFSTRDVATKFNNDLGSKLDARLTDDMRVAFHRGRLQLASRKGHIPTLEVVGIASFDDVTMPARLALKPDGTLALDLPKVSIERVGDEYHITGYCPDDLPTLLPGLLAKVQKTSERDGVTVDLSSMSSERFTASTPAVVTGTWNPKIYDIRPSIIKIAIATGHYVFGYDWSKSEDADRLRQCLHERDLSKWPPIRWRVPVEGAWEKWQWIWSLGSDTHVLGIIRQNDSLAFVSLLFGELGGLVEISAKASQYQELSDGGIVFVIDCRTRALTRLTLNQFLMR